MVRPRHPALEHERGDALVPLRAVDAGEDEEVVGEVRQADPDLLAVEAVGVAVAAGRGRAGCAASVPTPGSVRPNVASFSPRACGTSQRWRCSSVPHWRRASELSPTWTLWTTRNEVSARSSSSHRSAEADVVHPGAAVGLGDRRAEEAELAHPLEDLAMDLALLVPLADVRQDLGLGEVADGLAHELVLVGQGEVDHRRIVRGRAGGAIARSADRAGGAWRSIYSTDPSTRSPTDHDRRDVRRRPEPDPGPRPLLRADVEPRRGAPPVRHRRPGLPRLRERDRGHGARATCIRGSRPRSTPRSTGSIGPISAIGFTAPISRAGGRARRDLPGAARLGHVPELRLRGHRRRAQARAPGDRSARDHRLPRRLPRADVRGDQRDDLEPQLPDGLRAAPAGRLLRAVPGRLPRVRRQRGGGVGRQPRDPAVAAHVGRGADDGRRDPHRARPRRGRLRPGARLVPARPAGAVRRARDPAHRRRGPVGLRPDREDVGVRARRDRPRRGVRRQGDRQRPAAVGDRVEPRAPGALGSRRPRVDLRRQPGGLRRGVGGPRDDRATRAWSRTPPRVAPSWSRASARSRPRTTGSATSGAWG